MSSFLRCLLFSCFLFSGVHSSHAQDNDYLKHRKVFDLCSIHHQCFGCNNCGEERYKVKIRDNQDKRIKQVFYKFYSRTFNHIIEKEAKIEGDRIDVHQTGFLYVCVPDGRHWIISKIVYADESAMTFKLQERLDNFLQEPDECDCND